MKKYYLDGKRISKDDFEGWLYLLFCAATKKEREEAKKCFKNGKPWNGLEVK